MNLEERLSLCERARKILKSKRVALWRIDLLYNYKEYNTYTQIEYGGENWLTEEEFKILKEWWENDH